MLRRIFALLVLIFALPAPAAARPVLLISVDGLRPADVIEAEARGLAIPNLRRFVTDGAYASGVRGVLPTVTYPSHTTLLTGASPGRHGIVANVTFDPSQINQSGWFWYASDIRLPTLWQAAQGAGLRVGNIHWPVSVGASGIDWNLPQIWRTGHADDAKLLTTLATPGLVAELEGAVGDAYPLGIAEDLAGDEMRARFAIAMIGRHRPQFLTVYFAGLDHQQHADGPDAPTARAVLERLDAALGPVIAAHFAAHPDGVVALVSDHGFAPVTHDTNLFRAFIEAGLIVLGPDGKVQTWEAMPWPSGGSAAIMLARPEDSALAHRVHQALNSLQADPQADIAAILVGEQVAQAGGDPRASFSVNFRIGTTSGTFGNQARGLYGTPGSKGTHGWHPDAPEMRATFLLMGEGIPRGRALGEVDMRAIAPTLAQILGVRLEGAEVEGLGL